MHRETFITKLADIQQSAGQLLAELQASEHDYLVSHLYRSRQEYRLVREGNPIERCVISTFKIAESMGFQGDLRHWEDLLRISEGLSSNQRVVKFYNYNSAD
jgi:hypothetical protein